MITATVTLPRQSYLRALESLGMCWTQDSYGPFQCFVYYLWLRGMAETHGHCGQ